MDGRPKQYNDSFSTGRNLVNAIAEMLEQDKYDNEYLSRVPLKSVHTKPSADIMEQSILISHLELSDVMPHNLGTKSITYSMLHHVKLFYYYSRLDKGDMDTVLIEIRDALVFYFISHSSIEGLTTLGILIPEANIMPVLQGKYIYHAVEISLLIPVLYTFDRDKRVRPAYKQLRD